MNEVDVSVIGKTIGAPVLPWELLDVPGSLVGTTKRSSLTQVKDRIDIGGHRILTLRNYGVTLLHNDNTLVLPPAMNFLVTLYPPESSGDKELLSHAMQAWKELDVRAITESEIEPHATQLEAQRSA